MGTSFLECPALEHGSEKYSFFAFRGKRICVHRVLNGHGVHEQTLSCQPTQGLQGLQGVSLQPKTLADRLLVRHSQPASKKKKKYVGRGNSPYIN
eukprot:1144328-Pelagomonas_calceolata.AAC.1